MNDAHHLLLSRLAGPQATFVSGRGVHLTTADGRRIQDASSGVGVTCLGYTCPEVVDAITAQAGRLPYAHALRFDTPVLRELADRVVAHLPRPLKRAYFTSGGSEAVESAVKLVRQYWLERGQPRRWKVIGRRPSFHGNTLATLSMGWHVARRGRNLPLLLPFDHIDTPDTYRGCSSCDGTCDLGCADQLERLLAEDVDGEVACVIVEPVTGAAGGVLVPPEGYLAAVREICDRHGVLLIADETLSGFGRTGRWFAVEHWGLMPDLLVFGKGIAAGYAPLAGFGVSDAVIDVFERGSGRYEHNFTYAGHAVAAAAGVAVIDELERGQLVTGVAERAGLLRDAIERAALGCPLVGDVRGLGFLWAVELVADRKNRTPFAPEARLGSHAAALALEEDLLVYFSAGGRGADGDTIIVMPPFVTSDAEIDQLGERLGRTLARLADEVASGAPLAGGVA